MSICLKWADVRRGWVEDKQFSQTSIRAPPLGVSLTGCHTEVSALSRVSQKGQHGKIISPFSNIRMHILTIVSYWMLFAAILYLGIFFFFFLQ